MNINIEAESDSFIGNTTPIPSELQKFLRVNSCEYKRELIQCILDFANEKGDIQGRTRIFNAKKMAENAEAYFNDKTGVYPPNVITREFGLRQQAMYIKYYNR